MSAQVSIEITPRGGIRMLHSDDVNLSTFGNVDVSRASHVEWTQGRDLLGNPMGIRELLPRKKGWYVQSAKTGENLAEGFKTRAEALAWEKKHYSPGGKGWRELTEESK